MVLSAPSAEPASVSAMTASGNLLQGDGPSLPSFLESWQQQMAESSHAAPSGLDSSAGSLQGRSDSEVNAFVKNPNGGGARASASPIQSSVPEGKGAVKSRATSQHQRISRKTRAEDSLQNVRTVGHDFNAGSSTVLQVKAGEPGTDQAVQSPAEAVEAGAMSRQGLAHDRAALFNGSQAADVAGSPGSSISVASLQGRVNSIQASTGTIATKPDVARSAPEQRTEAGTSGEATDRTSSPLENTPGPLVSSNADHPSDAVLQVGDESAALHQDPQQGKVVSRSGAMPARSAISPTSVKAESTVVSSNHAPGDGYTASLNSAVPERNAPGGNAEKVKATSTAADPVAGRAALSHRAVAGNSEGQQVGWSGSRPEADAGSGLGSGRDLPSGSSNVRGQSLQAETAVAVSSGNREGVASNAFLALDNERAMQETAWIHSGQHRAEAGYLDPALGWIGVRAETVGGAIHASIVAGSPSAAEALGDHLAGLNAHLSQHLRHEAVVTVASTESGSAGSGGNAQSGTEQQPGQHKPSAEPIFAGSGKVIQQGMNEWSAAGSSMARAMEPGRISLIA